MHRVDLSNQVTENKLRHHGAEPGKKSLIRFVMHRNYGGKKNLYLPLDPSLYLSLSCVFDLMLENPPGG